MSLLYSMMPALAVAFLATKYSDFKWYLALISMIGVAFAHLSLNLFDSFFNNKNTLQGQTHSSKQCLLAACLFGLIACCFCVPVLILRGIRILYVVLGVVILGFLYSAPSFKLSYHGFGEIIIGMICGPALGIGMSIACSGEFHGREVMASCALGLLAVNVALVHSILNYENDQKAGRKTLASFAPYVLLSLFIFIPYILIIIAVVLHWLSAYYLVVLLTIPWSLGLLSYMLAFKKDPLGKVEKKWWYGSFPNLEETQNAGRLWYILRSFLVQKIFTGFSILCILASIADMIVKISQL